MPVLNIPRAGRNRKNYMETLIRNMYTDKSVFFRQGYGTCNFTCETVIDSFYFTRNIYYKLNPIKVHYLEVYVEYEHGIQAAHEIAGLLAGYIYEQGFQTFFSIADTGENYMVAFAVNAVSFKDGRSFHDNNMQYSEIYKILCRNFPFHWKLSATDNTFFNPKEGTGNYTHGQFA